ncbi:oxidoreductase [Marivibrio halodurans]|uniref:Oxidoreductase n=1 Tax=Marivibrio halodurans TaxID=2039722 RepID=A0A8J7V3Y6_9PROT|nr:MDR family oxidoreductase [Marivibrio halodurans]MBP5858870.1 oxidoreductase [Marivibrio halodurans]
MAGTFRALVLREGDDGKAKAGIEALTEDDLPEGEVTVAVDYSTLNYKDGMVVDGNKGRLARKFPHVPGIDLAGTVEHSSDDRYRPGDKVVLTGWHVGERYWGGFSQKARVKADWLVPLPNGLDTKHAMAVGTAGLTAMLCVLALEDHGLKAGNGPVLVTGASGGVGSVATAILAKRGHDVTALTGRPEEADYLKRLGATDILERSALSEPSDKPLESENWNHAVDTVGGSVLARAMGQMKYGTSIACCGLAGGPQVQTTVVPLLLRAVNLLGIDSVLQPFENRVRAWKRVTEDLPSEMLDTAMSTCTLDELPARAKDILKGRVRGRLVVDLAG